MQVGCSLIHHARTKVCHRFLQSDANRLFWIDSDIEWKISDFLRLLALSTKLECVSGIYSAKTDPPVFFVNVDDPTGELETNEYGCLPMKGLGIGFTVIQRKVIQELSARAPLRRYPGFDEKIPKVFRCDDDGDDDRGEDMAFFSDVNALGYKVWLDPSIVLGHIGPKVYSAKFTDYLCKVETAVAA